MVCKTMHNNRNANYIAKCNGLHTIHPNRISKKLLHFYQRKRAQFYLFLHHNFGLCPRSMANLGHSKNSNFWNHILY